MLPQTKHKYFQNPSEFHLTIAAGGCGRIRPAVLASWRVFVQSTSYNRVLVPDTGFL